MRGYYLADALVEYYYERFKTKEGFEYHFFNFLNENVKFEKPLKNPKNLLNYCWKVYSKLNENEKKNFLYGFMLYGKKIVELFENYKFVEAKKLLTTIKVNPEIFRDEVYYFDEEKFCFHIYSKRAGKIIGSIVNRERVLELCKYFKITLGGCYEAKSDNIRDYAGNIDNLV
jgi:hypothetical protein